jgi:hypothetical protein
LTFFVSSASSALSPATIVGERVKNLAGCDVEPEAGLAALDFR